jgi:hypothetical protein
VYDIGSGTGSFFQNLGEIFSQTIMGHTTNYRYIQVGYVEELEGIVRVGVDGLRKILSDLRVHDIDRCAEFNIAHMVSAQIYMHQTRDSVCFGGIAVEMDTLHQRRGTVANANDRDTNFFITHEM